MKMGRCDEQKVDDAHGAILHIGAKFNWSPLT